MRALIGLLAVRNLPVNAHGHYAIQIFSHHGFVYKSEQTLWCSLKETSLKKQEVEQNLYLFFNHAFWRRFIFWILLS